MIASGYTEDGGYKIMVKSMTRKAEDKTRKVDDEGGFHLVEACETMLGIDATEGHHWTMRLIRVLSTINFKCPDQYEAYLPFIQDLRAGDATAIMDAVLDFKHKRTHTRPGSVTLTEPCEVNTDAGKTMSYTAQERKIEKNADSATLPGWGDW